ncbi:MAG: penicillin-binding transpeptidase domain-containing protein [Clostridia bacterium]|nr:penicillin-binding transpeptidase domain-containing protein [Clostridia bacterium]
MPKAKRNQLRNRAIIALLFTCILGFGAGAYGLVNVGLVNGEKYKLKAESQQLSDTTVSALRGTIYDANMNIIAQSADAWKIWINPSKISDDETRQDIAQELSTVLELDYDTVLEKCSKSDYAYVLIKSQVDYDAKTQIIEFRQNHKGYNQIIGTEDDVKRYYPYGTFASSVLGFTGSDDVGLSGLEYYYDETLTGTKGRLVTAKNAKQIKMSSDYTAYYEAETGLNLQLTIDQVIQYYLDTALEEAVTLNNANYGYGIIMDVETGAILAMSTKPDFDANDPYAIADEQKAAEIAEMENEEEKSAATLEARYSQWRNRSICDSYEPGSVFKCITAAAGLEEGVVTTDEMFNCTGSYEVLDRTFHCSHRAGHGVEDFTTAMMNSCNPIFIEVAQRLGADTFYKYFEAFGFAEKTGIDLPAESEPVADVTYHSRSKLNAVAMASSSFGQTFQASPIQTITAINALANDGKLMQPYVVAAMLDSEGNKVYETKATVKRQVVSKETADTLKMMMEKVVSGGTAKNAYVPGYRVAGKTGTSQKLTVGENVYIASFCGFAPADDPRISVLIVVDEPKNGSITGGSVAGPVAAEVITNVMKYLNVEPQYTDDELAKLDVTTSKVVGDTVAEARKKLESTGFEVKVIGNGDTVAKQVPSAGQKLPKNGLVVLYTDKDAEPQMVTVPDLTGLSVAEANNTAIACGLNIKRVGYTSASNVAAYKQNVESGSEAQMGTVITVSFRTEITEED